jgi:AcrR family transcriptional regulator
MTDDVIATDVLASDGRVIGSRAQLTRRRLLDATAKSLAEQGALGVRVVDITRDIGSSPATFYQYFQDVEEALLALAEEATDEVAALQPILVASWDGPQGADRAIELVRQFRDYRDRNQAILRVRDLKAEEGDARFRAVRQIGYAKLMADLVTKVEGSQAAGRIPSSLNPYATSAGMLAMMERLLAYETEFNRRGVSQDAMVTTIAEILLQTIIGSH